MEVKVAMEASPTEVHPSGKAIDIDAKPTALVA